jgi:hypothetical protein
MKLKRRLTGFCLNNAQVVKEIDILLESDIK